MKLLYASSLTFPSGMSNRLQSLSMVKAFNKKLGKGFYFGFSKIKEKSNMESYLEYFEGLDGNRLFKVGQGRSYFLAFKYLKFIKKNKIDYVYCREPRLLFFLILYSKLFFWRFRQIKFIFEIHKIPKSFLDKVIHKALFRQVDYFLFLTCFLRDFYVKGYKCPIEKSLISPDGVDLDIFDTEVTKQTARQKFGLPLDKKIIGYFGRFRTMGMTKGLDTLLEVVKLLSEDAVLLMMGGKPRDIEHYKQMAEKMGLSRKVIFIEHLNQREVAQRQKACDALLMAYPHIEHYAYYMSPAKLFEHMASKRPIITSDLPSIREILSEKNAFFFPPEDVDILAKQINFVLSNREEAQKRADQAFLDVKQYAWSKRVENILTFMGTG